MSMHTLLGRQPPVQRDAQFCPLLVYISSYHWRAVMLDVAGCTGPEVVALWNICRNRTCRDGISWHMLQTVPEPSGAAGVCQLRVANESEHNAVAIVYFAYFSHVGNTLAPGR